MRPERGRERGAALLTVLLLVALIAVMAGTALEKMRLTTRLAGNAAAGEQARGYAGAAEAMAVARVGDLLAQAPDRVVDTGWVNQPFGLPVPGGIAVARVSDGGNCFNLNGLVIQSGGHGDYASYAPGRAQFVRLMTVLGIAPQSAEQVAAATSDWIDSDSSPLAGGAEDSDYAGRDPPYRTANTLMADASELRAVAGVTPDIYAALRPWICALPTALPSAINVNTLTPEQAPLLAMLLPDNSGMGAARAIIEKRPADGYADIASAFQAGGSAAGSASSAAVTTKWFALMVDVTLGGAEIEERGLIDASHLPPRLVSRQWGEP